MALTSAEIAYRRRLRIAAVLSLLLHAAFVVTLALNPGACSPASAGITADPKPLVVNLQPRDTEARKRLIDPAIPSTQPPDDTDLIAETNAQAQDISDAQGDESTPDMPKIGEFDALGGQPAPEAIPPAPTPPPADNAEEQPVPENDDVQVAPEPDPSSIELAQPATTNEAVGAPEAPASEDAQATAPALPLPFEVARAESLPIPGADATPPRARQPGGVEAQGFANFEAKQHELAPYLKSIREKVEREWRAALQMRYTGTTPTKAVIECTINPTGEIVSVEIIEPGSSVSYGPICKDAIQRAGPFGAFPFEVPPIYQNQNLEIRWTFSFM